DRAADEDRHQQRSRVHGGREQATAAATAQPDRRVLLDRVHGSATAGEPVAELPAVVVAARGAERAERAARSDRPRARPRAARGAEQRAARAAERRTGVLADP